MFGDIQKKLAELIAQDIYKSLKNLPAKLKELAQILKRSGQGLPEGVLLEFGRRFELAISTSRTDGYGKWKDGPNVVTLKFFLAATVIEYIKKSSGPTGWTTAASNAATGLKQIALVGGEQAFNDLINGVIPKLVEIAVAESVGKFHAYAGKTGFRVLTKTTDELVAEYTSKDFAPAHIFYIALGTEEETKVQYKLATKLTKKKPPIEGLYFNP